LNNLYKIMLPPSYKKMIDFLYSKGDNCSYEQKELRLIMFNNWVQWVFENSKLKNYQLSSRENEQLTRILNK